MGTEEPNRALVRQLSAHVVTDELHQLAHYDPPPEVAWQPVFLDEHLLVVNKPSGLLTVPGRGEHLHDCLIHRVQRHVPDALIVHRLDMDTSGLVVLARGADMQRTLSALFMHRRVGKRYQALVHGLLASPSGQIDLPLITDWPRRPRQKVCHEHGKPSLTRYEVLAQDAQAQRTRLSLEPVTGRSHQLRVHCLALGHPIVGDPLYGPQLVPEPGQGGHPPGTGASAGRLMLHATHLALPHPVGGKELAFELACPF